MDSEFAPVPPKDLKELLEKEQGYNGDIEKEINGDPAIEEGDLERDMELDEKDIEELKESGIYEEE